MPGAQREIRLTWERVIRALRAVMLFPHELYQKMSPELAAAGLAYLRKEDRETYKTGLSSLAIQRKLRPAFIQKRPGDKQIEWMVEIC